MATEYPGSVIPAAGYTQGNHAVDDEIMYSMVGYTQKGVTLTPGQGVIYAGTVMGRVTSTKLWQKYSDGNSPAGVGVARGILRQTVDTGTDAAGERLMGNLVIRGIVKYSKVSGADANAITDLNARADTVLGTFTF